jgi:hypothetical protein
MRLVERLQARTSDAEPVLFAKHLILSDVRELVKQPLFYPSLLVVEYCC